jgi:hypothetical protein
LLWRLAVVNERNGYYTSKWITLPCAVFRPLSKKRRGISYSGEGLRCIQLQTILDLSFSSGGPRVKPDGVIYMSFKQGELDDIRDGRLFTNYTEATIRDLLAGSIFDPIKIWNTRDIRPRSEHPDWLNILAQKV